MTSRHIILIGSLAIFGSSRPVPAQTELPSRTMLVYVAPILKEHFSLSPSEHVLNFSMPIQIPGVALPAGAYIFRLLAPSIVQVMSATRSKVYATLMTIPASGVGDTSRERVKFEFNPQDDLPRIVGWYLPGSTGYEFLYPKPKKGAREERPRDR